MFTVWVDCASLTTKGAENFRKCDILDRGDRYSASIDLIFSLVYLTF